MYVIITSKYMHTVMQTYTTVHTPSESKHYYTLNNRSPNAK